MLRNTVWVAVCGSATSITLAAVCFITLTSVTDFKGQQPLRQQVFGFLCTAFQVMLYASPLSVLYTVLKLRYKSRVRELIYMPLAVTLALNSVFWCIYGLFIADPFLIYPNGVGIVFSLLQVYLVRQFGVDDADNLVPVALAESSVALDMESSKDASELQ